MSAQSDPPKQSRSRGRTERAPRARLRGLGLLLGPLRDKFLRQYWPLRPFRYQGTAEQLARLTRLEALQSVPKLLAARAASYQDVTVFGGNGFAKHMPPREAMHFYQRGDNLGCSELETTVPELRAVLAELASELTGSVQHWSCGMFAACGGRGVTMHYDPVLTLNVQLRGEKVWRLAPNHHVEHPLVACDNHDDHAPRFATRPFPVAMPTDAITFRARPGNVVFIPRGYWHETDTFGESLALAFTVRPPTWRDAVLHELRERLERDAGWRAYAMGTAGSAQREALMAQLGALLAQLREVAGSIDPASVLDASSAAGVRAPPARRRT